MSHTWIHNPDTDGYWQCPNGLVKGYIEGGWELCDPPPEHNLAVAEGVAWREARAAEAAAAEKAAKKSTTDKAAASGESKEG